MRTALVSRDAQRSAGLPALRCARLYEEGTEVVVVRADIYERLSGLWYDDSSWSDDEMDRLSTEDADALGWEGMEAYRGEDQ